MRVLGIILVIVGVLALIYGGFSYTRRKTVLDAGPIQASVDQRHHIPVPPVAGAVAVVLGVVVIALDRRGGGGIA